MWFISSRRGKKRKSKLQYLPYTHLSFFWAVLHTLVCAHTFCMRVSECYHVLEFSFVVGYYNSPTFFLIIWILLLKPRRSREIVSCPQSYCGMTFLVLVTAFWLTVCNFLWLDQVSLFLWNRLLWKLTHDLLHHAQLFLLRFLKWGLTSLLPAIFALWFSNETIAQIYLDGILQVKGKWDEK